MGGPLEKGETQMYSKMRIFSSDKQWCGGTFENSK